MDTDTGKRILASILIFAVFIALLLAMNVQSYMLQSQCMKLRGNWSKDTCTFVGKVGE